MNPHTANDLPANAAGPPDLSGYQQWTSSLARLLEAARREIENDQCTAKALIVTASALLRVEVDRRADPGHAGSSGLAGWQRQRIQTFIDENLDQTIHVRRLSEIVRLSPAHFSRAFKRSFGAPPHAYIVRRRLERAIHLMLASDAPLSEIALTCGFTDQAHLSNVFRQHIGASPAGWRQNRRAAHRNLGSTRDSAAFAPLRADSRHGHLGDQP
jgi:transcriptional regulator GlxA family with amidase domain